MEIQLRPYQTDAVNRVRQLIHAGKRRILVCAPTGSGKTVLSAYIMDGASRKGSHTAFVVDRVNLIDQTSETFDTYGIDHGVMQASHWRWRPHKLVQLCSAQTLARRQWPESVLDVIDECHTVSAVVKARLAQNCSTVVGLTATPFTPGLGKLYDALVNVTTTNALIEQGFLSPYRIFAATEPNMKGVKVVAGEWQEDQAAERALEVVGDVVAEYLKHGEDRKFICSAVNTAHVEELQRQFQAAGILAAAYTYKVSDDERAEIVKEFRKPDSWIRGLITVTAASKGFDVPDIGVVIMARPLRKSLAEHIQFFGRGLRIAEGKKDCIILDHSGNCARFWDEWTTFFEEGCLELDDGRKREKKPKAKDEADNFMKCPQCRALHKRMPYCPVCGHEYPKKQAVAHVAGTLSELIASGDRKTLTRDIWPQVVGYARMRRMGEPERAKKMALALYHDMTGQWPKAEFDGTEPAALQPEVAKKIKSLNIRFAKRRAKAAAEASA